MHTFNPSTWEAEVEAGSLYELKASLIYAYIMGSRLAKAL